MKSITEYAEALQNALSHRLAKGYFESRARDMSIDLRGGLNQVIAAADSQLKCGLGLLRRYVLSEKGETARRELVGGLTRISLRPGTRAVPIRLGTEQKSLLGIIEADIPHILHVSSYIDYIHESAHFIYEAGKRKYDCKSFAKEHPEYVEQRLTEIFAFILTHVFVFPPGTGDAFLAHHLVAFEQTRQPEKGTAEETIRHVGEMLVRLAIARLAIPNDPNRRNWLNAKWSNQLNGPLARRNAIESALAEAGTALPDFHELWATPQSVGWIHCVREFEHIYPEIEPFMSDLWSFAMEVFGQYYNDACTSSISSGDLAAEIRDVVRDCLQNGYPLIRCRVRVRPSGRPDDTDDPDDAGIDPLLLSCVMLGEYLVRIQSARGKDLHLHRLPETGKACFAHQRKWNEFLVDRSEPSMYCCIPFEHGQRVKRQVALLKTFWDIAANLRGRRLNEAMQDNWLGEQ